MLGRLCAGIASVRATSVTIVLIVSIVSIVSKGVEDMGQTVNICLRYLIGAVRGNDDWMSSACATATDEALSCVVSDPVQGVPSSGSR